MLDLPKFKVPVFADNNFIVTEMAKFVIEE